MFGIDILPGLNYTTQKQLIKINIKSFFKKWWIFKLSILNPESSSGWQSGSSGWQGEFWFLGDTESSSEWYYELMTLFLDFLIWIFIIISPFLPSNSFDYIVSPIFPCKR